MRASVRKIQLGFLVLAIGCGSEATLNEPDTRAVQAAAARSASLVSVENTNEQEIWTPYVYPSACSGTEYFSVTARIRQKIQIKTYSDGTEVVTGHYNFAGLTVVDPDGNSYHLVRHGTFSQVMLTNGTYQAINEDTFKLRGHGVTEDLMFKVKLVWDGTGFIVEFEPIIGCK